MCVGWIEWLHRMWTEVTLLDYPGGPPEIEITFPAHVNERMTTCEINETIGQKEPRKAFQVALRK